MKMELSIILKIYQWVGMENLFHIGFTNYTGWVKNLGVRFVVALVIGEEELLKSISRNGVTLME
jgi:hypothetical protein